MSYALRNKTMRDDLLSGLIIGAAIGLVVVAVRMLLGGGAALALVLAGVGLGCVQILLSRRRARRVARPPGERPDPPRLPTPRRLSRHNPFAQELTHNWTGLDDHLSEENHPEGTRPNTENRERRATSDE